MKKISLFILFALICSGLFAQNNSILSNTDKSKITNKHFTFSFYTGLSVPVKGDKYWNAYWSPNYLVSASALYHLNNKLYLGLKLGYNHWVPNENNITRRLTEMTWSSSKSPADFNEATRALDVAEWPTHKGEANVIEIIPTLRYIIFSEYNKSSLFLQIGAGYSRYSANVDYTGYYQIFDDSGLQKQYNFTNYKKYEYTKPEINIGLGIKGGRFEILPLYSMIFTEESPTHFIGFNLGLSF